jgi:hypothetical protein
LPSLERCYVLAGRTFEVDCKPDRPDENASNTSRYVLGFPIGFIRLAMNPYVSALYEIITKGRNTNSYKFALWRALVKLAPDTEEPNPRITKLDLASQFLRYFWPLEIKYHLRQGIDPNKDPIVMKLIRQRVAAGMIKEGEALKDFQKRQPDDHAKLVVTIAHDAFDDVIPRFHTVHGAAIAPAIFTFAANKGQSEQSN